MKMHTAAIQMASETTAFGSIEWATTFYWHCYVRQALIGYSKLHDNLFSLPGASPQQRMVHKLSIHAGAKS